jgi:hypothetical protein
MSYERTIIIGRREWAVRVVERINEDNDYGECDDAKSTITLRIDKNRRRMAETYIHELLHAIEYTYKVNIRHRVINKLERALVAYLVRNHGKMARKV